jgi:hypothetical protein
VTGLYAQPNSSSAVISWVMPGLSVRILGLSSDLAYYAVAGSENSAQVSGFIAIKAVDARPAVGRARNLSVIYRQNDTTSRVIDVLAPGAVMGLLGVTVDGKWSAVAVHSPRPSIGWVASADVSREQPRAETMSLTQTHLSAENGSRVFDVLPPRQAVSLLGRNADGSWLALGSEDARKFRGWVGPSEVEYKVDLRTLPVLPLR